MSARDSQFHNKAIIDEIIGFVVEHYSSFMIEDALFQGLRRSIKDLVAELYMKYLHECKQVSYTSGCREEVEKYLNELLRTFYATSSEPVRLGAFRVLFHEVYRRVHGSLSYKSPEGVDIALHGVLREKLRVLLSEGWVQTESYHTGIDYVTLIEYPAGREQSVVVPLFIIAKSSPERVKEIELREAITKALQQGGVSGNIVYALKSIPGFTRIVLTRTMYEENEVEASCIANYHQEIPVYSDIACGIISIVFKDIPEMYERVVNDKVLARLSMSDWVEALLSLAIPILQVVVASASSPPKAPGDGGITIDSIIKHIRQEALRRIGTEVKQQLYNAENYVRQLRPVVEQKLTNVVNRYKNVSYEGTRIRIGL